MYCFTVKHTVGYSPSEIEQNIEKLETKFEDLTIAAIKELNKRRIAVKYAVLKLTALPASQKSEHRSFFKENLHELEKCTEYESLFARLNPYWNYLSPQLLYHLIKGFLNRTEAKKGMDSYNSELCQFRNKTLLRLFCQIDTERKNPPEDFFLIVARFERDIPVPDDITLQHVENFRQMYGKNYGLRDFALMLSAEVELNSYLVSFMAPRSIIGKLQSSIPKLILVKFGITGLNIAGKCVYGDLRISPPTSPPLLGSSQPYHRFSVISGQNSEEITVSQDMARSGLYKLFIALIVYYSFFICTESLEKHFNSLRELVKCRMVSHNVTITQFSDVVTSLSADTNGDYSAFLRHLETVLLKVIHHLECLGAMIYYWHYLSYDMLEHVALRLNLDGVEPEMQRFKEDAEEFRRCTTMAAFSQTEKMKRVCPPLYFEIVTKFQWSETDTLRRLEEFRMAFLRNYQLNSFSMILGFVEMIEPSHSFNVTWFIPHVVTKLLTSPLPESLTTQYAVSNIVRDLATSGKASCWNYYVSALTEVCFMFHDINFTCLVLLCITGILGEF